MVSEFYYFLFLIIKVFFCCGCGGKGHIAAGKGVLKIEKQDCNTWPTSPGTVLVQDTHFSLPSFQTNGDLFNDLPVTYPTSAAGIRCESLVFSK